MAYEELKRVLDQVKPAPSRQEAMLGALLTEERTESKMKTGKKLSRLAAGALAAAMALTIGAFAAVTGLDGRILNYFGGTQEQEALLSPAAVAVDKEIKDRGSTLHVRQVIADRYSAVILMDFTAPEGTALDGNYYALGATLTLDFTGLYGNNLNENCLAQGHWKCKVPLPETDPGRYVTPEAPMEIAGNQVTLASLYLSPISLAWELGKGTDDLETLGRSVLHKQEDWSEVVILMMANGRKISPKEIKFLHTQYKTDLRGQDRGRYCFGLPEIIDPAEATAVTLFDQSFDWNS